MKSKPGIQEAHTSSFLRLQKGLDLHTTGHEVNIKTEECWQSNKRKHLRRPWQSPWFAFHMFACWHTIKAGAAHSSHIKFFHLPHKRTQGKQANISFPRARAHGRPGHSRLPVARQNREPTIRLGARHICSGFQSRGRWFSQGRRAGSLSRRWWWRAVRDGVSWLVRTPAERGRAPTNPALLPKGGGGGQS